MNDEYENEEEQSSLESIGETIKRKKTLTNNVHRTYNPKVGKSILKKENHKSTINNTNNTKGANGLSSKNAKEKDDDLDFSTLGDVSGDKTISGLYNTTKFFARNKWMLIAICGGGFFFLILIVAAIFLLKNADTLNYQVGNQNSRYQKMYEEIDDIIIQYQAKYGVKIDKHLIVSIITSYKDASNYTDETTSGIFEAIEEYENRNKMSVMVETLAKYQIKTNAKCDKDSSSMRKIASNDDSVNIFNFWASEISKEKNYDCSGSDSATSYEISIEKGNLDDEKSGSVFYWNLIDEGFFREYYPEYFGGLSEEDYEKKAAEMLDYIYLYSETLKKYDTSSIAKSTCNGSAYWWPIGSRETSQSGNKLIANGEPINSAIVSRFSSSGALEITSNEEDVNIIASKGGTIKEVRDLGKDHTLEDDGKGSYVIIENYSDGYFTLYAYLEPNSITVEKGDTVVQGQVIGKMGINSENSTKMLRFELLFGSHESTDTSRRNPEDKIKKDDPRAGCNEFSLTTTSLLKQEFISLMNGYCISTNHRGFCDNFNANAELIYDISLRNNVNPELVVVTAGTEQNWNKCAGLYNFWGIGISNGQGCSSGPQLTSMEAGIKKYASTINSYLESGAYADSITKRYNERLNAGCDPSGYGLPGTLSGMQSVYSWIGTYRYDPGSWGLGGCVYLDIIYGSGYCSRVKTCKDEKNCPASSKTTTCEQSDYTAWQLKEKVELRQKIFGL